jgi:MurNAc alpha-1-phosphate uridylyltransferase
MKAIILAAGRGERLRPLTDHTPKPLAEVQGKPLIAWHFDRLYDAGINDVVINISWLKNKITDFVNQQVSSKFNILFSDEGDQALETGGGIKKALPLLGKEAFVTISADVFTDFSLRNISKLSNHHWAHLVLVKNPAHHPQGDFTIQGNQLMLKKAGMPSYTYSGIGVFHPDLFAEHETGSVFRIAPLIRKAIKLGRATAQIHSGHWSDVGTLERLDELNQQQ